MIAVCSVDVLRVKRKIGTSGEQSVDFGLFPPDTMTSAEFM
jgi:hypothetical protein